MWECVFEVNVEGVRLPVSTVALPDAGALAMLSMAPKSSTEDQTYRLTCRLPARDGMEATNRAEAALQKFFDRMAVLHRARFHGFHHVCSSEVTPEGVMINPAPIAVRVSAHIVKELSEGDVLRACAAPWSHLAQTFRHAATADDEVARFLMLYHVLLLTCGDDQGAVEKYLRSEDPGLPTTPSPRGGWPETVLTRLRNEVAHPERKVPLEQTRREMKHWVGRLEDFARVAVLSNM